MTLIDLQKRKGPITVKRVLEKLKKEIINDYKAGDDLVKTEREWRKRITEIAKVMNIKLKSHSRECKNTVGKLINQQARHSDNSSSSSKGSTLRRNIMDSNDKQNVIEIYKQMDKGKMWKLSTGKVVELEMMKMAERCQFKHPFHSFIFDTEDENWLDFFTAEEIKEIKSHNVREMPKLPENLSGLLDSIHPLNMDDLHKSLSEEYFHPKNEHACHWAQKSLLEGIELHMSEFLKDKNYSERDLMSRIWRLVLTVFDHSRITIREEIPSAATSRQKNRKRKLSAVEPIERKLNSKTPDHIMKFGAYEIGLAEGAKLEGNKGNKFFEDVMFKSPKIMKDMMSILVEAAPHKKNSLRTVGLVISHK